MPLHVPVSDMVADALIAHLLEQPIEQHRGVAATNGRANTVPGQVADEPIDQATVAGDPADPSDEPGRLIGARGVWVYCSGAGLLGEPAAAFGEQLAVVVDVAAIGSAYPGELRDHQPHGGVCCCRSPFAAHFGAGCDNRVSDATRVGCAGVDDLQRLAGPVWTCRPWDLGLTDQRALYAIVPCQPKAEGQPVSRVFD